MKKITSCFLLMCFTSLLLQAQSSNDSLRGILPTLQGKERLDVLCKLVRNLPPRDSALAKKYDQEAMLLADNSANPDWQIAAWNARASFHASNYLENLACTDYLQVAAIAEKNGKEKEAAGAYVNAGRMTFNHTHNLKLALEFYDKAITIHRSIGNKEGEARAYANIGTLLSSQKRFAEANSYYKKALTNLSDSEAIASVYNNIAAILANQGKIDSAIYWMKKSLHIKETLNDSSLIADACGNLGGLYTELGDTANAALYLNRALQINTEIGDPVSIIFNQLNLGELFIKQKKYAQAEQLLITAMQSVEQQNRAPVQIAIYQGLSKLYSETKDFEKAYLYEKKANTLKEEELNADISKQTGEMQARFDVNRREKDIATLEAASAHKNLLIWASVGGAVFFLVLAFMLFRRYQDKQRSNQALESQNALITSQKSEIEVKNKEITDSIAYASRLQEAIMSDEENLNRIFPDSFVLFRPKDIVSGDFFWVAERDTAQGKLIFIAVVDCTGHGVPGALLSMIGSNLLHQAIFEKKYTDAAEILGELNRGVHQLLHTRGNDRDRDDGMDIGFCVLNKDTGHLSFAGANRSLLHWRNNQEMQEYQADRTSIGGNTAISYIYKKQEQQLQEGDVLYLFTDGYADQFGGPDGKKLMTKKLRMLLSEQASKNLVDQRQYYANHFEHWKGEYEQVDDVLIVGWKYSR